MSADDSSAHVPHIVVPDLCDPHKHELIVRRLRVPRTGPWRATIVVAQVLLAQRGMSSRRIHRRIGGDPQQYSVVLAEIGCLACWDKDGFRRVVRVLRRGLSHAGAVSQLRAEDPDWSLEDVP